MKTYVENVYDACEKAMLDCNGPLLCLYALLAMTTGETTSAANVHDAWALWRAVYTSATYHPDIVPFQQLPKRIQDLDQFYAEAIRSVARRMRSSMSLPGSEPSQFPTPVELDRAQRDRMEPGLRIARDTILRALAAASPNGKGERWLDWPRGVTAEQMDVLRAELVAAGWVVRTESSPQGSFLVVTPASAAEAERAGRDPLLL